MTQEFGNISSALSPLREILQHGRIGILYRLCERSQFAGVLERDWQEGVERFLTAEETVVWKLLFQRSDVPLQSGIEVLSDACIQLLQDRCLVNVEGSMLRNCGYSLRPVQGFYVFTGFGKSMPGKRTEYVHLGVDSLAVGDLIQYFPAGTRALELCAGSGILCLCLARQFQQVVGVELCDEVRG